ncbi:MAG TPA: hypothetical protein VFO79_06285, partial [Xanthomonadales bacterium]|nr:hypothetical protein [Xanthomonadales bacterium]
MRALLVLLLVTTASAETRVYVHAGGGLESGLITGAPFLGAVAELGAGIDYLLDGRQWGFGAVIERVARSRSELPIGSEH